MITLALKYVCEKWKWRERGKLRIVALVNVFELLSDGTGRKLEILRWLKISNALSNKLTNDIGGASKVWDKIGFIVNNECQLVVSVKNVADWLV